MISAEEYQRGLSTRVFGKKLFVYNSIDSTNTQAKSLAVSGAEEGTVVLADYQTAGRGRLGRHWTSEPGANMLLSVIIRPPDRNELAGVLPFFAALSVAAAIETFSGFTCECKWPNDLLLNGKKCGGILIESAIQNSVLVYAVVGIGLNVNQLLFDEELGSKVTSLRRESGREFNRRDVFQQVMTSLEMFYGRIQKGSFDTIFTDWESRTSMKGKQITLSQSGTTIAGRVLSFAPDGGLLVATAEGERTFYAGDVTVTKQD